MMPRIIMFALQVACLVLLGLGGAVGEERAGLVQLPHNAPAMIPDWVLQALPERYKGDAAKVVALEVTTQAITVDGGCGRPIPPGATADLEWLKHFPHVKNLRLSGKFVTDPVLAHLGCLAELESLRLLSAPLNGEGFAHLASLEKLRELFIGAWLPTQKGMACLASLDNIETLTVNMRLVPDGWVTQLGRMKNLKRLRLGGGFRLTTANQAGLQALARVQRLELLLGMSTDDTVLGVLGTLRNLSLLQLQGSNITDDGLALLERLPQLENLDLRETKITDVGLAHVGRMKALRILNLSGTAISGDGLKQLASLAALEQLNLAGTRIGDEGLAHLAALKSLRDLDLTGTGVTEAGMVHLKGLSNLTRLAVTADYLTDEGTIKFVMDGNRVRNMLSHIEGLQIEFWSRWEDEQFGRWSPKGGAAPVFKPTEESPDHKVSKWICD